MDNEKIMMVGKIFTVKKLLYNTPIKSDKFGIFIVKDLSTNFKLCRNNEFVEKNIVILSYGKYCVNITE